MLFADDIFLFGSCEEDLRVMMFNITVMLRNAGLDINGAKSSFLCNGGPKKWRIPGTCCNEDGMKVLGRKIDLHCPTDIDMSARIRHGFWKFSLMRGVFWQGTPLRHRVDLLYSTVLQAILWGAETWTPTKARLSRLRVTRLSMLRSFVKLPKVDLSPDAPHQRIQHDRHCVKYMKSIKKPLLDEIFLRKSFRWGGHVARLEGNRHAKWLLCWRDLKWWRREQLKDDGFRHFHRDGNRSKWEAALVRYVGLNWQTVAQNRERWRKSEDAFVQAFKEVHPRKICTSHMVPKTWCTAHTSSASSHMHVPPSEVPRKRSTPLDSREVPRKRCTESYPWVPPKLSTDHSQIKSSSCPKKRGRSADRQPCGVSNDSSSSDDSSTSSSSTTTSESSSPRLNCGRQSLLKSSSSDVTQHLSTKRVCTGKTL